MKEHNRSIYGCTQAPAEFKAPQNCLLTYNPAASRLYVHVLDWPMGVLHLDGYAGRIAYAQLLNDASEVKFSEEKASREIGATSGRQPSGKNLNLQIPVRQPKRHGPRDRTVS